MSDDHDLAEHLFPRRYGRRRYGEIPAAILRLIGYGKFEVAEETFLQAQTGRETAIKRRFFAHNGRRIDGCERGLFFSLLQPDMAGYAAPVTRPPNPDHAARGVYLPGASGRRAISARMHSETTPHILAYLSPGINSGFGSPAFRVLNLAIRPSVSSKSAWF